MNKIIKSSILAVFCMLALGLTACGNSNPLIGKWEGQATIIGMTQVFTVEFTATEVIVRQREENLGGRSMNLWGGSEVREPIYYRMEGGKMLISKNKIRWDAVDMPDKDTVVFDIGIAVMTLKRQ